MIRAVPFHAWADTAHTLHMILQMMGKVKLVRMTPQPEWNHALLQITPSGFTTGLIPDGATSFDITYDLRASEVTATCTSGLQAGFPVHDARSVSDYYAAFVQMLAHIGHEVTINTAPQEVANTTPFEQQTDAHPYDQNAARDYFDTAVFAHNALLTFAAPFRNKKILPSMFWGTFDMTTVLFNGLEKPFPGKGLIERVAFDEQFIEFGFWPGDPAADEPSFFVLPYPFLEKDYESDAVSPAEAFYSPEKKEYFLSLRDALTHDDPAETVRQFCQDAFNHVARGEAWPNIDWCTKPLYHQK